MRVEFLRKKYPRFIYQKYSYKIHQGNLKISFLFEVPPDIKFKPQLIIKNVTRLRPNPSILVKNIPRNVLDNLVFHLGLMEIPSYWKATCSPIIEIRAGFLNFEQIDWWKDLIIKGMGQFFYENKINFKEPNFLRIKSVSVTKQNLVTFKKELSDRYLVPVGGGKDSIVTLEKLKERGKKISCFLINPTKAMNNIVKVARIKNLVIVRREIDPVLLELNKKGYLNGHTPITALISFLSVLAAVLFNYKNIAFSNEKSANEGNLKYLGKIINHQWSKSSEFERKFKWYLRKYLAKNVNYFSFLRKYTELNISRMFTKYPQYFSIFSSCNLVLAKKLKKRWCGNCPKCLFVYVTLYPFLERKELLKIFSNDMFQNKSLLPTMCDLLGQACPPKLRKQRRRSHKPFECVGTFKESKMAFQMSLKKARKIDKIPWLLSLLVKR